MFRIIEVATGYDIHSVTGFHRQIPLPVSGEFEYHWTAQMNVPPGTYHVSLSIWDKASNTHVFTAPKLQVEVLATTPFDGTVQMNSRWLAARLGTPEQVSSTELSGARQTA